jgi:hypothetical protein
MAKNFIEEELKVLTKLNDGFKKQLMDFEKEIRNISEASHDFFALPKRRSIPPVQFRILDRVITNDILLMTTNIIVQSQKSRSLNNSPATPQRRVNSASPRKTNSARKAKVNPNELFHTVKDTIDLKAHRNLSSVKLENSDIANKDVKTRGDSVISGSMERSEVV